MWINLLHFSEKILYLCTDFRVGQAPKTLGNSRVCKNQLMLLYAVMGFFVFSRIHTYYFSLSQKLSLDLTLNLNPAASLKVYFLGLRG
jgi:hypothetical protein